MYEFFYDYLKSKHDGKAKWRYVDTNSFMVHIET